MNFLIVMLIIFFGVSLNDTYRYSESGFIKKQVNKNNIRERQTTTNVDVAVTQQLFSAVISGVHLNT